MTLCFVFLPVRDVRVPVWLQSRLSAGRLLDVTTGNAGKSHDDVTVFARHIIKHTASMVNT